MIDRHSYVHTHTHTHTTHTHTHTHTPTLQPTHSSFSPHHQTTAVIQTTCHSAPHIVLKLSCQSCRAFSRQPLSYHISRQYEKNRVAQHNLQVDYGSLHFVMDQLHCLIPRNFHKGAVCRHFNYKPFHC